MKGGRKERRKKQRKGNKGMPEGRGKRVERQKEMVEKE